MKGDITWASFQNLMFCLTKDGHWWTRIFMMLQQTCVADRRPTSKPLVADSFSQHVHDDVFRFSDVSEIRSLSYPQISLLNLLRSVHDWDGETHTPSNGNDENSEDVKTYQNTNLSGVTRTARTLNESCRKTWDWRCVEKKVTPKIRERSRVGRFFRCLVRSFEASGIWSNNFTTRSSKRPVGET